MKRWITSLLAAALLLTGVCACGDQDQTAGSSLWFVRRLENGSLSLDQTDYHGELMAEDLMEALLAGPVMGTGLVSPIPEGVTVRRITFGSGILQVDLSGAYNTLFGVDLTLADYCIALTLCQIPGVEGVRITVNGRNQVHREQQIFRREDVVISGAEEEPVERTVSLCFRRVGGNELGVELRVFRLTESQSATMAVLQALLAGPQEADLTALLPAEVEVYSARVEAGVCYADFSAALLELVPASEEEQRLVVRSVVESLCSLGYVQAVQILVEGEPLARYGQVDVSQPLSE